MSTLENTPKPFTVGAFLGLMSTVLFFVGGGVFIGYVAGGCTSAPPVLYLWMIWLGYALFYAWPVAHILFEYLPEVPRQVRRLSHEGAAIGGILMLAGISHGDIAQSTMFILLGALALVRIALLVAKLFYRTAEPAPTSGE